MNELLESMKAQMDAMPQMVEDVLRATLQSIAPQLATVRVADGGSGQAAAATAAASGEAVGVAAASGESAEAEAGAASASASGESEGAAEADFPEILRPLTGVCLPSLKALGTYEMAWRLIYHGRGDSWPALATLFPVYVAGSRKRW